jgi:hypothetical protein
MPGQVAGERQDVSVGRHFSQMLPAHAKNIAVILDMPDLLRINAIDIAHKEIFKILYLNRMFNDVSCKGGSFVLWKSRLSGCGIFGIKYLPGDEVVSKTLRHRPTPDGKRGKPRRGTPS